MIRLILILLVITSLSLGLAWVADEPGRIAIDWGEYHADASLLVLIAGIAVMGAFFMAVYAFLFLLIRTPRNWMRARQAKRQTLGLEALTEAFAALATQDAHAAKRQIARAQQYLPNEPLTLMFAAQAARLEGNESQARLYFEKMRGSEVTNFMALRNLMEAARQSGDTRTAISHAEKALAIKPHDKWLITALAGLYTQQDRAQDALRLLDQSSRKRYITGPELRQISAYVLYENAAALMEQRRWDFAIAMLQDALRRQPGFVPASALLAEAHLKQNEIRRALKVIGNAWKTAPHPALTDALIACYNANLDRAKVIHTAEKLMQTHPEQRETQFLRARFAMRRHDAESARHILTHALEGGHSARGCLLMAELENMRDNLEEADIWAKRAAVAPPDATWVCTTCHQPSDLWRLICRHCGSVASLVWK